MIYYTGGHLCNQCPTDRTIKCEFDPQHIIYRSAYPDMADLCICGHKLADHPGEIPACLYCSCLRYGNPTV